MPGRQKKKLSPQEAAARGEAALNRRVLRRMEREREEGTVFFLGPVETGFRELKLRGNRLTFLRPEGSEYGELHAYLLRRLEWFFWEGDRLTIRGEFYFQSGEWVYYVREKEARIRRASFTFPRPLENEIILRDFLDQARREAAAIPPTPRKEMTLGLLKALCVPVAGIAMAMALVPGILVQSALCRETKGTLEGFDEIGGRHYPRYTYSLPDGTLLRCTGTQVSLEDSVAPEEVVRILRRRCPRQITVRYSRKRPGESSCIYL